MRYWKRLKAFVKKERKNNKCFPLLPFFDYNEGMYYKVLLTLILVLIGAYVATRPTFALNMSNSQWILQMGSVNNNFAGLKSGSGYTLRDTGGQVAPGLYSGTGGKVRAGFQYIGSLIPFSFKISGEGVTSVDFGIIDPTNPVTRTQTLSVTNGSAHGFVVTIAENHALLDPPTGSSIPDTTCNAGDCTSTTATLWDSIFAYGFGYRCDQVGVTNYCPTDFATTNFYRPVANTSLSQNPATVMSGANVGRNMQVQITYKANISTSQGAGFYSNVLTYVLTPTF